MKGKNANRQPMSGSSAAEADLTTVMQASWKASSQMSECKPKKEEKGKTGRGGWMSKQLLTL